MKKALVLGASGGMGYAIVKELIGRDVDVIAFSRGKKKLESLYHHEEKVTIFPGDVMDVQQILDAAIDVDVIFHSVNCPYHEWPDKLPEIMKNVLQAADQQRAKVAYVDNIYSYGRSKASKVTELTEKKPHTKKGKIRLQLERQMKESAVPVVIAHFPDFYGPNADNAMLQYTINGVLRNKKANVVGDLHTPREFIYTPDGAKAIVELASTESAYGQNWNIPATDVITGNELVNLMKEITGHKKGVGAVSKRMIKFIGIFNPFMREVVEMMYLTEDPVILDGEKYEQVIGELPRTPYREGLKETIEFYQEKLG
ncbi:SDR family NAD(P)-dependent oxidoreductase [Evansella sp. AB-P1]|uniref:SDR family NAD(P)-dependent oxidoreductase n=1 Tax=Evansella sp. AB-P1 TaxID=3037653 RepID=UPI00241CBA14|nr:SDR family NAD(P)-dependent oxidoreductase [Evansella sp. AB-P1]MDG5790071.1 SDR family NAD(P)-dependent oxidoreductase [Evansella sp. AB-P1]